VFTSENPVLPGMSKNTNGTQQINLNLN